MCEQDENSPDTPPVDEQSSSAGVTPRLDLLVDEHEEEVSVDGKTVRHQGIYLLPNLFTTGALFAGFYAIITAMRGDFENAGAAIIIAMVLDGLDGRIARLTNTSSKFGGEYDSLADMVSFGVAPALVVFSWGLGDLGKFGWSAAFIYVACAALRLARFNTQIETANRNFFTGLASPSAAGIIASTVWVCNDLGLVGDAVPVELAVLVGVLTAIVGFFMIANFPYYSFKDIELRRRVPFVVVIAVVFVFGLITLDPPSILLVGFAAYALSGPVMLVVRRRRRRG
jgi:CDP-diacylglycerol--serine O-phosphatidyltransferase